MSTINVRTARLEDAQAIWEIYRYYVEQTAISFEITMPTPDQIRQRIEKVLTAFPYLVAEAEGKILGYAYAGPFIPREAYAHCAEVSIYISRESRRCGIGRLLYDELAAQLCAQGITQIYACIGVPEEEDEYLSNNSAEFHAHLGFREVGRFRNSGRKFDRFYHMIWMEKLI